MFLINRFLIIVIIFTTYINNIKAIVVIVTIILTHKNKCIPASNKRNVPLGGKKHVSKNVWTIADYDYPNYLFHIYSMISRFVAHCDFIILFLKVLTLSVPVIMAVLCLPPTLVGRHIVFVLSVCSSHSLSAQLL
jgi:hypothetical protein